MKPLTIKEQMLLLDVRLEAMTKENARLQEECKSREESHISQHWEVCMFRDEIKRLHAQVERMQKVVDAAREVAEELWGHGFSCLEPLDKALAELEAVE